MSRRGGVLSAVHRIRLLVVVALFAGGAWAGRAGDGGRAVEGSAPRSAEAAPHAGCAGGGPGAAANVDGREIPELSLGELFRRPVGPRGLEFSDRARELSGRTVRMSGYIARQAIPIPFAALLTPRPITLHEREYGLAEDLPANIVHVFFARSAQPFLLRSQSPVTLTGVLEIGPHEEADGRISQVRLRVPRPIEAVLPAAC